MIILLVGPSGSGKSYFERMCEDIGIKRVKSTTTRKQRPNESGDAYYFTDKDKFKEMREAGLFAEVTEYCGEFYGALRSEFVSPCVVTAEPQGMREIQEAFPGEVYTIYFHVPDEVRKQRMLQRGDTEQEAEKRLANDREVFTDEVKKFCDMVFHNTTHDELANLLKHVSKLALISG